MKVNKLQCDEQNHGSTAASTLAEMVLNHGKGGAPDMGNYDVVGFEIMSILRFDKERVSPKIVEAYFEELQHNYHYPEELFGTI